MRHSDRHTKRIKQAAERRARVARQRQRNIIYPDRTPATDRQACRCTQTEAETQREKRRQKGKRAIILTD